MILREELEKRERQILSPFAAKSGDTRGREREEEPCPVRTHYQRDRDRIIHSKAFRRLKHKTQVFIAPEGDHFRTRLTHTLEVAQVARTIARGLNLNEDLVEAIALGHDLGHTPFGHAGEDALNLIYPPGFKHNEQSLRVVDHLEQGTGLNLTWEVRDGILHHTGPQKPATLEGQIVKLADRFAYINHDIDDAQRAGIIQQADLPGECLAVLGKDHRSRIHRMILDMIEASWDKDEITMGPEVQQATLELRAFMFRNVYIGSMAKTEETKAKNLLKNLYHYFLDQPYHLPPEYFGRIAAEGVERVVVDYIAGMTDRFALKVYEKHFLPTPWRRE